MRIDGAVQIEEVNMDAWIRLAGEIGVSERFARPTTAAVVERVCHLLGGAHRRGWPPAVETIVRRFEVLDG